MKILTVEKGSQADTQGIRAGDRIVAVDGHHVRDLIDLMFYSGGGDLVTLTLHRGTYEYKAGLRSDEDYGITVEPLDVARCGNNCLFCFIDQNPPGMRKEIYLKDEDYRLSFLHGSYITLSDLSENDMQRIVAQRLSPLYISVHSTSTPVRLKLLGRAKDDRLRDVMDRLLGAGIEMHCQIVVCPGINDGDVLERTILELMKRFPRILSVAVVPVGLTRHRDGLPPIKPVEGDSARGIIGLVGGLHDRSARETGSGFVYCADELFLRAGFDIPGAGYYDGFPQYENGVGMVRRFIDDTADMERRLSGRLKRTGEFVLVTGMSMGPLLDDFARRASAVPGISARVVTVANDFYGESITVSGLLTGGDIGRALAGTQKNEIVVLPPNCLNNDGVFLDDMEPGDLAESLGTEVIVGDYDPVSVFT
ncbi:MAG: DUF512 domain-containing protein [Candidatus Latescibacteria bacterium]|nr:DUF512 domain-containing protein [Candidatus Latescibacterota bacterium]